MFVVSIIFTILTVGGILWYMGLLDEVIRVGIQTVNTSVLPPSDYIPSPRYTIPRNAGVVIL